MAVIEYAINVSQTNFPLLSINQPETIINNSTGEVDPSAPAVAYCHNVMPTGQGYNSTEIVYSIPPIEILEENEFVVTNRIVYSTDKNKFTLAFTTKNNAYLLDLNATPVDWVKLPDFLPTPPPTTPPTIERTYTITTGTVNGVSYIYFDTVGCYTFDETAPELTEVTLTGLSTSDVLGVVASGGYLCAYTEDSIAWSSTIDPTDFVPSDITGAGGGKLQEIRGSVVFCTPNYTGFLVHTEDNIVAAILTSSLAFPFKFSPVAGSKGSTNLLAVTYEDNAKEQFVFTEAGMQSIVGSEATNILGSVTDFLSGKLYEDFDDETLSFTYTNLTISSLEMKTALSFVSNRYLVISYGIASPAVQFPNYTYALVYDVELKRVGKVKTVHSDVIELYNNQESPATSSIGFLKSDGQVDYLDFSVTADSEGVIMLGALQFSRDRLITLQGVTVGYVSTGSNVDAFDRYSVTGDSIVATSSGLANIVSSYNKTKFSCRIQAKVHNIILKGKFSINTVIASFTIAGRR